MASLQVPDLFWPMAKLLIPLAVLAAIIRILPEIAVDVWEWYKRRKNFQRNSKWLSDRDLIAWLRGIKPSEFEKYIADLFRQLGYKTILNGGPHDGGIDLIAEKDGVEHYIQCKKYITSEVGVSAIRDFYGAMAGRAARGKGFFITTNKFSLDAEKFAEDKPIELIDSFKLVESIRLAERQDIEIKSTSDTRCPKCGGKLVQRNGKFGRFVGCIKYPSCKYTSKNNVSV